MRLAYFISTNINLGGGGEISSTRLTTALAKRGHVVHVFHGFADKSSVSCNGNLTIHSLHHQIISHLSTLIANYHILRAFKEEHKKQNFDLVVVKGAGSAFGALFLRSVPMMYINVDILSGLEYKSSMTQLRRILNAVRLLPLFLIEFFALRKASCIFVDSSPQISEIERIYHLKLNHIYVLPLGIPDQWFEIENFNDSPRNPTFVMVASKRRNVELFLQTLISLRQDNINVRGVILRGDAVGVNRLSPLISANGIGDCVTIFSMTKEDHIREIFSKSIAHIMPSYREGFCLPIIEAASQGTPSIIYPLPQLMDFVVDNINGIIVDDMEASSWTAQMRMLVSRHDVWLNLSKNALRDSRKYAMSKIAERFESICLDVLFQPQHSVEGGRKGRQH